MIADIDVDGRKRKVIMQLNRNGFLYVIDRTNGKLLAANAFEKVNWASHVDNETGRPVETDIAKSIRAGNATEHWPSTRGGKNWPHAAFNPQTGLLYANTLHEGRMYKHLEIKPHVVGQRYQFIENLPLPRPADEPLGHMEAIDPLTAKKKWRTPLMDFQIWSAMLATGGGLLFTGKSASSLQSMPTPARWSGSSRPDRASMPCRSLTRTRADNTSPCYPASAGCTGTSRGSGSRTRCRKADPFG